ncbi:MAG TPA: IS66 family transposase [Azonexus sp.]|nr:IS66 family transposase [Burkholderiaceae bacterium]HEX5675919.1 IS66 family transposase [Azonexus sp.]
MSTVACEAGPSVSTDDAKATPFSQQWVKLTKQEYIELVMQARSWKSLHERAVRRNQWLHGLLRRQRDQAEQRELALRAQLDLAQAKIRDLQLRMYGRKSERRWSVEGLARDRAAALRPRGQQRGAPGHARTRLTHLGGCEETVELESPQCPRCGASLSIFPGTDDSEVLEIEVRAYRRVIRRRRYRCGCGCGVLPRIVAAPAPPRLIERGKFGISVWVNVLLDKFLYGCPSQRLLRELADHGLPMSAGTLAGGLRTLAPLFEPLHEALREKLRSEPHWHADETRWEVFVELQGKVGHRWYLWVFQSRSVVHYVLDESRSCSVVEAELAGVEHGYLSCDRHGAYKKHARQHPGIVLAYCWAHQRRDWLMLGNDHPELQAWAMQWVEQIGQLYRLHGLRARAAAQGADGAEYAVLDAQLRCAVQCMAEQRDAALADAATHSAARKVLLSMNKHWAGLTVFVEQPWLAMDNNAAERAIRPAVVGRKNFYGSGSLWSGQLAATMYSVLMTARLWGLNARTWLSQYLHACAASGNRAPPDISGFLPWAMDAARLAAMRAVHTGRGGHHGIDTS